MAPIGNCLPVVRFQRAGIQVFRVDARAHVAQVQALPLFAASFPWRKFYPSKNFQGNTMRESMKALATRRAHGKRTVTLIIPPPDPQPARSKFRLWARRQDRQRQKARGKIRVFIARHGALSFFVQSRLRDFSCSTPDYTLADHVAVSISAARQGSVQATRPVALHGAQAIPVALPRQKMREFQSSRPPGNARFLISTCNLVS